MSLVITACGAVDRTPAKASSGVIPTALPASRIEVSGSNCPEDREGLDAMRIAVLDLHDGAPVAHARVYVDDKGSLATADGEGAHRWPRGAIPGRGTVRIACPGRHQLDYRTAIIGRWPYSLSGCLDVVARVDPSRCAEQAEQAHFVRLRGMYVMAFEESAFYPCDGMPADASEFTGAPHMIWVESADMDMSSVALATFQRAIEGRKDGHALFVDWSGTLRGPGTTGTWVWGCMVSMQPKCIAQA